MPAYSPPVSDLLSLGRCDWRQWHDYSHFYFSLEHVPELLQMATDWPLMDHDDDETIWAPVHAWRVLGILSTAEAAECLLQLLWNDRQDDFYIPDYLPDAVGRLGLAAFIPLCLRTDDPCLARQERLLPINALVAMQEYHPSLKSDIAGQFKKLLADTVDDNEHLNSVIIDALVKMGCADALPLIEQAYERGKVDRAILGELDDLESELNLKENAPTVVEGEFDAHQEKLLADFLQTCGHKALSITGVKGLLFAIANAPVEVPPDRWQTLVFGSETPPFVSEEQGSSIRHTLFNLLASIHETILSGREVLPPECMAKTVESEQFERLKEWSNGYGQGSNMLMDVWTDVLKHPQIAQWEESWSSCMILLNVWSNADSLLEKARSAKSGDGPDVEKMLEAMPAVAREMAVMSHDIRGIVQKSVIKTEPVRVEKVGRNDPCPCGSGKKYKKCCGR